MQGITFGRMNLSSQIPRFSGKRDNDSHSSPAVSDAEGDTVQFEYPYAAIGALQERSKNLKQEISQHQASLDFAKLSEEQRQTEEKKIQELETEREKLKQVIAAKQKVELQTALNALKNI